MSLTAVCVDDSRVELDYIARILSELGVTVVARCQSGDDGMREIRARRPSMALLDITGVDGLGILEKIVKENLPTMPIMCTSMVMLKKKAKAVGAQFFISKPYDEHVTANELQPIFEKLRT